MDVQKEILQLRKEINHHSKLYYVYDAPIISDYDFDMLMQRLKALEAAHPELITPDSPTQRVGGQVLSQFTPVHHQVPLESLTDVFSYDELFAFGERMNMKTAFLSAEQRAATAQQGRMSQKTCVQCGLSRCGLKTPRKG